MADVPADGGAPLDGIADYRFVSFLRAGNNGNVYLAKAPSRLPASGEHVAVKVLLDSANASALQVLTRELRLFAVVRSPYLVRLLDAGQEGTRCYYAMEHHPRGSLAAPDRPLRREEVLRAVASAARAAHALHEAGVAHRDIKPANILLDDQAAKLADLGHSEPLASPEQPSTVGDIDTIEFLDPMLLRGGYVDRASDIWSLGATLHRALTGTSIYGEIPLGEPLVVLRHVLAHGPRCDESLAPHDVALINACLAEDPRQRPPTALLVAERAEALAA